MTDHPIIILGHRVLAQPRQHDGAQVERLVRVDDVLSLVELVEETLAALTANHASFTAYDVTMILRIRFPYRRRQLPHYDQDRQPGVQPEVHRQMAAYRASGVYTMMTSYPNGIDPAWLYTPSSRRRRRNHRFEIPGLSPTSPATALPARAWVVRQTSN